MSFTLPVVHQFDPISTAPSEVTRQFQATTTTSTSASSSTSSVNVSPTSGTYSSNGYDQNDTSFTTSWITYLAIIIVAGVLVALLSSRYFYVRRYYSTPSFRAYFLPQNGIHVKWLRLKIKGAEGRHQYRFGMGGGGGGTRDLEQVYGASVGQRDPNGRRRRRRRNQRQTVGETLGVGGTRLGERDQDDLWDDEHDEGEGEGDELGMAERGAGGGSTMRLGRPQDELPQYIADSGLPAYVAPPTNPPPPPPVGLASPSDSSTPSDPPDGTSIPRIQSPEDEDEIDRLPTAAEYEALSRGNRDVNNNHNVIAYPPIAHLHGGGGSQRYPLEPPPSFSRANSGVSTRSSIRRGPTGATTNGGGGGGTGTIDSSSRSTFEGEGEEDDDSDEFEDARTGRPGQSEEGESAEEEERRKKEKMIEDELEERRRRQSTVTASSSATKLDDSDSTLSSLEDQNDSSSNSKKQQRQSKDQ